MLGEVPVPVADPVVRVLPALVEEPLRRPPLVLHEPVAVAVAVLVDPLERPERVRPQAVDERPVAGPVPGRAEEHEPQRRGVDGAVVGPVRGLAGAGHLAGPQLVQDLAGLGVARRVVLGRLEPREDLEGLDGELRPDRERLERPDDRVAPEQRREPRDAGGQVALVRVRALVDEQPQVARRAVDGQVEQLVVGADLGEAALPGVVRGRDRVGVDARHGREEDRVGLDRAIAHGRRLARRRPGHPGELPRRALRQGPAPAEADPAGVRGAGHLGLHGPGRRGRPRRRRRASRAGSRPGRRSGT